MRDDANSIGQLGTWKGDTEDGRSAWTARQRVGRAPGFAGAEMFKEWDPVDEFATVRTRSCGAVQQNTNGKLRLGHWNARALGRQAGTSTPNGTSLTQEHAQSNVIHLQALPIKMGKGQSHSKDRLGAWICG